MALSFRKFTLVAGLVTILLATLSLLLIGFTSVSGSKPVLQPNYNPKVIELSNQGKVLSVPYLNQGDTNWCFDASLAMVLQFYGEFVDVSDIATTLGQSPQLSINFFDIIIGRISTYVSQWPSLSVDYSYGIWDFDHYKEKVDASSPIITSSFSLPFTKQGHTIVVTGYLIQDDQRYLIINDPSGYLSCSTWKRSNTYNVLINWREFESFSQSAWSHVIVHQAS